VRDLRGKTALVTGAASGIGRALALRLAREGVELWLLDRQAGLLETTAEQIRLDHGVARTLTCDLSDPQQVAAAAQSLVRQHGGVDLLVNNAGLAYYGNTVEMPPEHFQLLLRVNLLAAVQLTCELLPTLLDRREAHVLNVASICGLIGLGRVSAYTTSKFGLVGFSESLRAEYGRRGLGVTALCPGLVDTALFASAVPERPGRPPRLPPRWLMTTPDKIADCAVAAIRRNRAVAVTPFYARGIHALKRFAPGMLDLVHHLRRPRRTVAAPGGRAAESRPLDVPRAA